MGAVARAAPPMRPRSRQKESSSFLKKRTKKLLVLMTLVTSVYTPRDKSLSPLFFRKEVLA
jgi:hypothetical protein